MDFRSLKQFVQGGNLHGQPVSRSVLTLLQQSILKQPFLEDVRQDVMQKSLSWGRGPHPAVQSILSIFKHYSLPPE